MNLINIQFGQAVRLMPIDGLQGNLYGPNLTKAFEAKYAFLQGPRVVAEYDLSKGIAFHHGFFEKCVIDKFTIFSDGVICETKVDTAIADQFIDAALGWARDEAGFAISADVIGAGARIYLSRLDIQTDLTLGRALSAFTGIGKSIAIAIKSYGHTAPADYQPASVQLHVDNLGKVPAISPGPFSFERLAGQPYSAGRWFSQAPLRTDDHLRLLNELEAGLRD
jgi:hypothetical protein